MKRNTRLQQSALMLALVTAYPVLSYGAAGTTQFIAGDVSLRRGSAPATPLAKGTVLESGDAITTGARGVAQVKFSDGGYVAIQPNSQFDITRYADSGNAQQDSFLVNLARGGMRAITGLIGKRNTANYKVTTNTATVGIRGSAFHLAYNPDGSLSVSTEQDAIEVCTPSGCVGINVGESVIVPSDNSAPIRTNTRATLPLAPFRQDPEVAGNQTNPDGTAAIVPSVPIVQTGIAFAGSGLEDGYYGTAWVHMDGALTTQGGTPLSHLNTYNEESYAADGATTTVHYASGTPGTSDFIVLGTWSTGVRDYNGESAYPYTPLSFVAGVPTSSVNMSALGGFSATYSLAGASPIWSTDGSVGTLLSSSHMAVNFNGYSAEGSINLDVNLPYQGNSGYTYNLSGSIYGEGAYFYSYLYGGEGGSANAQGFFSGTSAQHAGVSYNGSGDGRSFGGAAVFGQSSLTAGPLSLYGYAVTGAGYAGEGFDRFYDSGVELVVDSADNTNIQSFLVGSYDQTRSGSMTVHSSIDLGGSDGKLVLGTWSSSTWSDGESSGSYSPFSFVAGVPTSDIGALGNFSASYAKYDASPVHVSDGSSGTLDYATLAVTFNNGSSAADMTMGITLPYGGGTSYALTGTVSGSGSAFSGALSTSSGNSANADVNGYFYGSSAQYAGIGYSGYASTQGNSFGGAAILYQSGSFYAPQTGTYNNLTSVAMWPSLGAEPTAMTTSHTFGSDGSQQYLTAASGGGNSFSSATNSSFASQGDSSYGDFVGWGKWASVSTTITPGPGSTNDNAHYVVGTPTPSQYWLDNLSGTATYTSVGAGGTTPTSSTGASGTFSSATMNLTFGSTPTVSATVVTEFGGNNVTGTVNGMAITSGSVFKGTEGSSIMSGLFVGPNAERAGLVYSIDGSAFGAGTVTGAAGLVKN